MINKNKKFDIFKTLFRFKINLMANNSYKKLEKSLFRILLIQNFIDLYYYCIDTYHRSKIKEKLTHRKSTYCENCDNFQFVKFRNFI